MKHPFYKYRVVITKNGKEVRGGVFHARTKTSALKKARHANQKMRKYSPSGWAARYRWAVRKKRRRR